MHSATTELDVFDQQLLNVLRCPLDRSALTLAESRLVRQINQGIAAGKIINMAGQPLNRPIDGGLIRAAGDVLYPVIDAIPVMLPDEAVDLSQLQGEP